MQTIRWVGCVLFSIASIAICHGEEPGAKKVSPFWERPKSSIDLQGLVPADVKLAAIPNGEQGIVVLQVGDFVPPVDFVFSNEDLQQFIPKQDTGYAIVSRGLVGDAKTYGDRNYKIEVLPKQIEGLTLLRTKGGHKAIADITYSIVLVAPKPCLVFVAIDQRVMETYSNHGTPGWLNEFEPTGELIKTDDPLMAQAGVGFAVFVRRSGGGHIALGPPSMDTSRNSMYFAFFGEAKP